MFSMAIVRTPAKSMVDGITTAGLGIPDYDLALEQHRNYVRALEACDLSVVTLDADERYPDAQFIEDTALLLSRCAIVAYGQSYAGNCFFDPRTWAAEVQTQKPIVTEFSST